MSDCPYCNRRKNFTTLFNGQDYAEVRIVMNDTLFIHKSCQTRKLGTLVPRGIVVLGNSLPFNCFYDVQYIDQKNRKHNIYIGSGTVIVDELNDND